MAYNNVLFPGNIKLCDVHIRNTVVSNDSLKESDFTYPYKANFNSPVVVNDSDTENLITIKITETKILLIYYKTDKFYYKIGTIDSLYDIAFTSELEMKFLGTVSNIINLTLVSSSKILITYNYNNFESRMALVEILSDNSYTVLDFITINSTISTDYSTLYFDDKYFVVSYIDTNDNIGYIIPFIIQNNVFVFNSDNKIDFNYSIDTISALCMVKTSESSFIATYKNGSSGKSKPFTIEGLNITYGEEIDFLYFKELNSVTYASDIVKINNNTLIYIKSQNVGTLYVNDLNLSYNNSRFYLEDIDIASVKKIKALYYDNIIILIYEKSDNSLHHKIFFWNEDFINLEYTYENISTQTNGFSYLNIENKDNYFYSFYKNENDNKMYYIKGNTELSTEKQDFLSFWVKDSTQCIASFKSDYDEFIPTYIDFKPIGNISGLVNSLDNFTFTIKRKKQLDTTFKIIKSDILSNIKTYTDNSVANNTTYTYFLEVTSLNGVPVQQFQKEIVISFEGWFLSDENNNFNFFAGFDSIKTGSISVNKTMNKYDNYGKYPVISFNNSRFKTGSMTVMPLRLNETSLEYEIDLDLETEIENFIENETPKWLRSPAGEVLTVTIGNFSIKYDDKIESQPYEISFDWIEVGEE